MEVSLHSISYSYYGFMLRTLAYIIFFCTGLFVFVLIVLFVRSQDNTTPTGTIDSRTTFLGTSHDQKTLDTVIRAYKFHSTEQKDIFGTLIFQFDVDIMMSDHIMMYHFTEDYSTIKKNLLLLGALYDFRETTDFFGKTFFLNDKSGDTRIIRFVTEVDGRAVGFEVLKVEYDRFKSLLLQ